MSQIEGDCPDDTVGMGDCVAANANKICYDANGVKTGLGKRGWRMFYVTLRELVLFCFKVNCNL